MSFQVQEDDCLHLLLRSSAAALESCLAVAGPGDSIVLLGTAVFLLIEPGVWPESGQIPRVFLHSADIKAHGLDRFEQIAEFPTVSEQELVDLVCRHRHCLSWK